MWCQRPSLTDRGSWATWLGRGGRRCERCGEENRGSCKVSQEMFEFNCGALQTRTAISRVKASKRQPAAVNSPDERVRRIKF